MTTMSNPLQAQALATMLSGNNGTPAAGAYNPAMSNAQGANNAIMPLINALAQRRMQQMFNQQQNGQAAAPNLVPGGAGQLTGSGAAGAPALSDTPNSNFMLGNDNSW